MASFAASRAGGLAGGRRRGTYIVGGGGGAYIAGGGGGAYKTNGNNEVTKYVKYVLALNNAKAKYYAAKKAYNNQKRSVSGGLSGWINRRKFGNAGEQARKARNNQLNAALKNRMNRAKTALNNVEKIHNGLQRRMWYRISGSSVTNNANWRIKQARKNRQG